MKKFLSKIDQKQNKKLFFLKIIIAYSTFIIHAIYISFYLPTTSQNSSKDVQGNNSSRYVANTCSEAFNIASSLCLIYSAKTDGHWLSDNILTFYEKTREDNKIK